MPSPCRGGGVYGPSEFDEAYEDEPGHYEREEESLGQAILDATIRDLEPKPAATLQGDGHDPRGGSAHAGEPPRAAILVEREGVPVGIFTERDLMRRVVAAGIGLDRAIEEVMTPDPETLGLDDGVAFALNRMSVGGFRNIPIVDENGAVVGHPLAARGRRLHRVAPPEPRHQPPAPPGPRSPREDGG